MDGTRARLCLSMIVRDEAAIIERCLESVAPWVDAYAVHDTGSTDGTPDLVRAVFDRHGVPGRVSHGVFVDFAQARNEALDVAEAVAAEQGAVYLLLCDADMELVVEDPTFRDGLSATGYLVDQRAPGLHYANVRLVRAGTGARYVGVTHEYVDLGAGTRSPLGGLWFRDHAEGSSRSVKFERDLRLLEEAVAADSTEPRSAFYLAQTLRDLGRDRAAVAAYEHRVALGGWEEEIWYSLLQIALLRERLGYPDEVVLAAYLAAFERRPHRAETLVELSRHLRERGPRYDLAHVFATRAVELARTDDLLFVDPASYGWRARDELSITSYWVGRFAESAALAESLLADPELPPTHRDRVEDNLAHARRRLSLD